MQVSQPFPSHLTFLVSHADWIKGLQGGVEWGRKLRSRNSVLVAPGYPRPCGLAPGKVHECSEPSGNGCPRLPSAGAGREHSKAHPNQGSNCNCPYFLIAWSSPYSPAPLSLTIAFFFFLFKVLFLFMYMCGCMPVCRYVHISTGACRGQKVLDPLELELLYRHKEPLPYVAAKNTVL